MRDLARKLGARIKEVRRSRRLSQERLAEKAQISPRYLSRLEVGQQTPSLETLGRLADELGLELWELFDFGHHGRPKELRGLVHKMLRESDEAKLRLAVKVFRAILR